MSILPQLVANALVTTAIYALAASGLSFIYATTRIFHLGHGAVVALGAYLFWWLGFDLNWPLWVAVLVSVLGCAGVGLLMNEIVYEPLRRRNLKGFSFLVAAVALLVLGNAVLLAVFGSSPKSAALDSPVYVVAGATITSIQIGVIIASAVLLILLTLFVHKTKFGRAMRATQDNEAVASVLGINPALIRRLTFLIGSALGGIAGAMLFLELNIDPNAGLLIAVKAFTAVVVGGAGTIEGAVIGSLLLSVVEQGSVWYLSQSWKDGVGFILLFVFLIFRPTGIFGKNRFA